MIELVNKSNVVAVNCLTGCFVELHRRLNINEGAPRLSESQLLERGRGYLFRTGNDEYKLPEYTFAVEETGLRGISESGISSRKIAVDSQRMAEQLREICERFGGTVVWVNSSRLSYSKLFSEAPGYLHAILILEVSSDLSRVRIYDALVTEAQRFSCEAWISIEECSRAITEKVKTEVYDHMGFLHVLELGIEPRGEKVKSTYTCLKEQADSFFEQEKHRGAIGAYATANIECFLAEGPLKARAARRLFDHIRSLYILPALQLFQESLRRSGFARLVPDCEELMNDWSALSIMALKFEATGASNLVPRIEAKFAEVDAKTNALWRKIRDGKIVVLGKPADVADFVNFAEQQGLPLLFIEPSEFRFESDGTSLAAEGLVLGQVKEHDVMDVISFHDGLQTLSERLRHQLGMGRRAPAAVEILTDKSIFKNHPAVRPHIAKFLVLDSKQTLEQIKSELQKEGLAYPLVVKPSNAFYSAGVMRADNDEGLIKAVQSAKRVCGMMSKLRGGSKLVFESYIDGAEFAIDGFVGERKVDQIELKPTVFIRKFPDLTGPAFHEIAYIAEAFDFEKGKPFFKVIESVLKGVGLSNSPFHAEFRRTQSGELFLLEIAPRLSGAGATANNLLQICLGANAYEVLLGMVTLDELSKHPPLAVALEYDFCAEKNGFLTNVEGLVSECSKREAETILRYANDGKFVMAPPVNVETVLTAFFKYSSTSDAERQAFDLFSNHKVETSMEAR